MKLCETCGKDYYHCRCVFSNVRPAVPASIDPTIGQLRHESREDRSKGTCGTIGLVHIDGDTLNSRHLAVYSWPDGFWYAAEGDNLCYGSYPTESEAWGAGIMALRLRYGCDLVISAADALLEAAREVTGGHGESIHTDLFRAAEAYAEARGKK